MADDALTAPVRPAGLALGVAAAAAVAAVGLQIAYPLVGAPVRGRLAVAIVIALAAASLAHAGRTRGPAAALALLVVTAVPGFAVEVLGVHTGGPFGRYAYTGVLGPRLFGVPPVVGLAWTMLAWPAALAARRLARAPVARVLVGAWALASADLFLDPQLVAAGAWRWAHPAPHLPGVAAVPLTNYAGWLVVALALSVAVQAVADRPATGSDALPVIIYGWLYVGWFVALSAFLGRPAAAGWGALGMGLVAVPLLVSAVAAASGRGGRR